MDATAFATFVDKLVGAENAKQMFEKQQNAQRAAVELIFQDLTPSLKDVIREGMTFRLVDGKGKKKEKSFDKRGQEYAIDSHGSVKKGHGLSSEDQPKVQKAMDAIVELTSKALKKENSEGYPLFSKYNPDGTTMLVKHNPNDPNETPHPVPDLQAIADEIFSPLVREGLLPETFVIDQYSEVQRLINETFKGYKVTLKEKVEDKEKEAAKREADFHGAGGKLDTLKAAKGKIEARKKLMMDSMGLTEDRMRKMKIGVETVKTGIAISKAGKSVKGWIPGSDVNIKALALAEKQLHPERFISDLSPDRQAQLGDNPDPDAISTLFAQQKREERLTNYMGKIGEILGPTCPLSQDQLESLAQQIAEKAEVLESDEYFYSTSSAGLAKTLIGDGIDIGLKSKELHAVTKALEGAHHDILASEAADAAVEAIDAVLTTEMAKGIKPAAGAAIDGLFSKSVDTHALHEAVSSTPDGTAAVAVLADGLSSALEAAAPSPEKRYLDVFADAGKAMADAFKKLGLGKDLEKAIQEDPKSAFKPLVKGAASAVQAGITEDLKKLLSDDETIQKMAVKSIMPDEVVALEELEAAEDEIKEFERMLVLVDEGGISAAEQRSIEKLIAQLEQDRRVLELVSQLGGTLEGVGGTAVGIAAWASEGLTDTVAGQITGPLKAAKLIMQLAINVKKAADRWRLWYKFKVDLERSKIAVSALTSTIQGFYNNKKEQIAFHTIEDALIAVQIAAAILGSIPSPYTVAIGKTMSAVAGAAEQARKVSQMIYNEKMLSKAWSTTKEAMNNPSDRRLALKALRLNPTLGMHAIAWAGMERQPPDPIARMVLDSVGLNEQTLAVSGTEKKVRQYLETLLNEDRQLLDPSKIKVNWMPASYSLCAKDWFVITKRAMDEATPKLRSGGEMEVFEALKALDGHDLKALDKRAEIGDIDEDEMQKLLDEINAVYNALEKYSPRATDNSVHDDMSNVVSDFITRAGQHRIHLRAIADTNETARNPSRAFNMLNAYIDTFTDILGKEDSDKPIPDQILGHLREAHDEARGDLDKLRKSKAFVRDDVLQQKMKQLENLLERAKKKFK